MTTTERRRRFFSPDATAAQTPSERKLEDAFAQFKPELLGTLFHLLGNLDDAQDALQDAFVRCWKKRNQLDEIVNLRAWVFRVAHNVGVDSLKSGWRRRRKAVDVSEIGPVSRENLPEETLLENERVAFLRGAIQELDESERAIFLLRQNGALTYEQIAQTTGIPVGTVKSKMRRALANLRAAANKSADEARRRLAERAEKIESNEKTETTGKDGENVATVENVKDGETNREAKR